MLYLAWDIDGTLLLTNRAGYDALQEAICDYFFRKEPYEFKHTLAGCTDSSIIKEIVTDIKGHCTSGWAASLMLKYEMYLKSNLKLHKGYLMPNVEKTLRYLSENAPEITNLLLTGNTANGARDKVAEYGIARYFDFRHSSYGDLAEDRDQFRKVMDKLGIPMAESGMASTVEQAIAAGRTRLCSFCAKRDAISGVATDNVDVSDYIPEEAVEEAADEVAVSADRYGAICG